jgi:hypothetical protein
VRGREGGPGGAWREGGSGGRGVWAAEPGHWRATLQRRTWEQGSPRCGTSATLPGGVAKFDSISNFKRIQILSSIDQSKNDFPELKSIEIKYGHKGFKERNNFLHRNFFRFKMKIELKFQEASMSWNQGKCDWKILGTWILVKFGQHVPFYTFLQGKINFQQIWVKFWIPSESGILDWFLDSLNYKLNF